MSRIRAIFVAACGVLLLVGSVGPGPASASALVTISGAVVLSDGVTPAEDVRVEWNSTNGPATGSAVTDSSGEFLLLHVTPGAIRVSLRFGPLPFGSEVVVTDPLIVTADVPDLGLSLPELQAMSVEATDVGGAPISGYACLRVDPADDAPPPPPGFSVTQRVLPVAFDMADGHPAVMLLQRDEAGGSPDLVRWCQPTDANGRADLATLERPWLRYSAAVAESSGALRSALSPSYAPVAGLHVPVVLPDVVDVSVRVVRSDGSPVTASVTVAWSSEVGLARGEVTTGSAGSFILTGVPPGRVSVTLASEELLPPETSARASGEVGAGQELTLSLPPVTEVRVLGQDAAGAARPSLRLCIAEVMFQSIHRPIYVQTRYSMADGWSTPQVVQQLYSGSWNDSAATSLNCAETGPDGYAVLPVLAGDGHLAVIAVDADGTTRPAWRSSFLVAQGSPVTVATVEEDLVAVSGTLRAFDGAPVSDAQVNWYPPTGAWVRSATTDDAGQYAVLVPRGTALVGDVRSENWVKGTIVRRHRPPGMSFAGDTTVHDITLPPVNQVRVRALDSHGVPAVGVEACLDDIRILPSGGEWSGMQILGWGNSGCEVVNAEGEAVLSYLAGDPRPLRVIVADPRNLNRSVTSQDFDPASDGLIELVLPDIPGAPDQMVVEQQRRTTSAVIRWAAPTDDGGADVTGYDIRLTADPSATDSAGLRSVRSAQQPLTINIDDPQARSYKADGLLPGMVYSVAVRAKNKVGLGVAAVSRVLIKSLPARVTWFTVAFPRRGQAVVSWRAPRATRALPILRYEFCTAKCSRASEWQALGRNGAGPVRSVMLTRLIQYRTYSIQVRAVNRIGPGPGEIYRFSPRA